MRGKMYRYRGKVSRSMGALSVLEVCIFMVAVILIVIFMITKGFYVDTSKQYIEVSTGYTYNVTATMYGKDISNLFKVEGEVNTEKIGKYTIEYVFKGLSFLPRIEREINVVDTTPPEITLIGDTEIHLYDIEHYKELGFSATDNFEGNLTNSVYTELKMVSEGKYELKYLCMDSSENKGEAVRTIYINPAVGAVYLTFDDGPSNVTESILQTLEEKGVKATFFIIGYNEFKEPILRQIYEAGHTIGLHGLSHDYSKIYLSSEIAVQNFDDLREMVKETLGIDTYFVRFPGGSSNTFSRNYCKGVMTEATQEVLEKGYTYFDWNVDSQDAGSARTADEVCQNVINGIMPGKSNIVLMHDSAGHEFTAEALPKIIDWCLEHGYEIRPINQDTPVVTHKVNN